MSILNKRIMLKQDEIIRIKLSAHDLANAIKEHSAPTTINELRRIAAMQANYARMMEECAHLKTGLYAMQRNRTNAIRLLLLTCNN